MNIVDAIIIILLILGVMSGFRRGFIKQTVLLIGLLLVIVLSYYLKNPLATFFYKHLPFFNFDGIFKGVSIINILIYELLAFIIVFSILYLLLRLVLKITGLIEKIFKLTIVLGIVSKILGGIVGFIEGYVLIFILLFVANLPFVNISGLEESWAANKILYNTPVLSSSVKNTNEVVREINNLSKVYKDDSNEFNKQSINMFIKYDIINQENVDYLKEKGKIK